MANAKEELRKAAASLKPAERLQKLRELEKDRKEEIDEIADLIRASQEELVSEQRDEDPGERADTDLAQLLAEDFAAFQEIIREEHPLIPEDEIQGYARFQRTYDYGSGDATYQPLVSPLPESSMEAVDKIGEIANNSKYMSASIEMANILVAGRATLYKTKKYAGIEGPQFF